MITFSSNTSTGGIKACNPLAKTDLPVPLPPAIITPPKLGSTAASNNDSFNKLCPVIAASGKALKESFSLIISCIDFLTLESLSKLNFKIPDIEFIQ